MKIYLVTGETGEYSDHSEWNVKSFFNEEQAKRFAEKLNLIAKEAEKFEYEERKVIESLLREAGDLNARIYYTGVFYQVEEVEIQEVVYIDNKGFWQKLWKEPWELWNWKVYCDWLEDKGKDKTVLEPALSLIESATSCWMQKKNDEITIVSSETSMRLRLYSNGEFIEVNLGSLNEEQWQEQLVNKTSYRLLWRKNQETLT